MTGQSLEAERRQAAAVAARARKAGEKVVKAAKYFDELKNEAADAIMAVLAGDFDKLNHMSGHMRNLISSSIEIFEGLLKGLAGASDYNKGYSMGRATFEVGSFFVPWGAAFKAISIAGKVSKGKFLTELGGKSKFFQSGKGAEALVAPRKTTSRSHGMRHFLFQRNFQSTCGIRVMMLWCLPFLLWADEVPERRSGVLAPLDESTFLEVRGGKMVDHVATSRLFLVRKNKDYFEIASWQRNYKVYLELGLEEVPAVGVYSGASIVEGRMENGVVVAVVEYNRAHYLVAAREIANSISR